MSNRREDSVGKRQIDRRILGSFPVGTPYDSLYGKKEVPFSGFRNINWVGISLVEVYKRVGKSVIWVCERAQKGQQMNFTAL